MSNEPTDRDIKPCPFCGAAPRVVDDTSYGECNVFCVCTAEPGVVRRVGELPEAIAAWNTRASSASEERAVLTELLRLYDWRFELADEERALRNTPIAQGDIRELAQLPEQAFDAKSLLTRRNSLDAKLRQYGREKRAAWDRAREVLARREKEGKDK